MADLKGEICETNRFPQSKKIKYDSPRGDDAGNTKTQIPTSGVSDFQASESITDNVYESALIYEDKQSSERVASDRPTSTKSDVSIETGLNTGSFETDGSNTMTHDSKYWTESSCSNSLSVVLPVLEASKEAYSFGNCGGSTDSSNSKAVDPMLEEPVTTSSESGVSAQVACKAINNARTMSSMKNSSVVENCSSSPSKKGDREILFTAGFDLNEDINSNEMEDCIQPVIPAVPSHGVIHVVAKAGIPNGQPMIPLKFEGGLGWRGSAETSAFRPTCSQNHSPKDSRGFTGIDLNVPAVEDHVSNRSAMVQDSRSEVDAKRAKTLWFDLNHLYDEADEFTQRSLSAKAENLNANVSIGNKTSLFANRGKWDSNFRSSEAKDFQTLMAGRVASLQQKSSFISHTIPPPHYYPSTGPFHFNSSNPIRIPFSGIMPYARYSHEHGIFPFGTPHLVQVVPNQRDVKSSTSENKMEESRKFLFLGRNSTMGDTINQEALCEKRKEPEGGSECYYKQMI